jgi:uncharacterized membrane protein YgcG
MTSLMKTVEQAMFVLLTAAALAAANMTMPLPGTVNYVEGQATLNGESLLESSVGSAAIEANQVLDTTQGKVELLLSPGVFLRLGDDSELRLVSAEATGIALELVKGEAILEVGQLSKGVQLSILMDGGTANITKPGLYVFGAEERSIGAPAGEADVYQGKAHLTLKSGHAVLLLSGQPLKSRNLDMAAMENDPLFIWSANRSQYLAQGAIQAGQAMAAGGSPYAAEWFWDSFLDCFAFLPGGGFLYSPFGWGFYAGGTVVIAPHKIHFPLPIRKPKPKPQARSRSASSAKPARSGGGGGHMGGGHVGGGGGHMGGGGRR